MTFFCDFRSCVPVEFLSGNFTWEHGLTPFFTTFFLTCSHVLIYLINNSIKRKKKKKKKNKGIRKRVLETIWRKGLIYGNEFFRHGNTGHGNNFQTGGASC